MEKAESDIKKVDSEMEETDSDMEEVDSKMEEMTMVLDKQTDEMVAEIDKMIIIKWRKEKRTSRTYLIGLEGFTDVIGDIPKFCSKIKKTMGTGATVIEEDGVKMYGFQGQLTDRLYNVLLEIGINKNKIKK
jgi:translation initiation factor 1 (eIF-1/SUI1)